MRRLSLIKNLGGTHEHQWGIIPNEQYSVAFGLGLAYGIMYSSQLINDTSHYIEFVTTARDGQELKYADLYDFDGIFDQFADEEVWLWERLVFNMEGLLERTCDNCYAFVLNLNRRNDDQATVAVFILQDLSFLQGLFTGLKACNIPITDVLLYKPYKDGVFYDILGLELTRPPTT